MKKNTVLYVIAIALVAFSFLSFISTYREMRLYSDLTMTSIKVHGGFKELSKEVIKASIMNPLLTKEIDTLEINFFYADSLSIINELKSLDKNIRDSINRKIVGELNLVLIPEISWLLRSNVPDSIINKKAKKHLSALNSIHLLINKGINRTNFLFDRREEKLNAAMKALKIKITFFLICSGALLGYITLGLFRQRAKRQEKEIELDRQEKKFKTMVEHMMEGVQLIGFDWRYLYVNDALVKYSNYKFEQMIGRSVMELYPGVEHTPLYAALSKCMFERSNHQLESEFVFPDGTKKYFDLSIQPVPEGIFILSVDITERKKTEDALQQNIKELIDYKYAIDESSIVAITDQKGIIQHVNDNFCAISKYSREQLIGKDHHIINSGYHDKAFMRNLWSTIAHGRIWNGEIKNKASDGTIYWVDTTIVPFLNSEGKPYQYLAIRNDITERKKGEEEIIKLNRLYAFISAINQSIVHITDADKLLNKACDIAVETGGFTLARIELLNAKGELDLMGISGDTNGTDIVSQLKHTDYSAHVTRSTPVGKALRSGKYEVNNDLMNDLALKTLCETFERVGVRSAISLPLKREGKMIGVFNLSSSQKDFFDKREVDLLLEAAGDISFALENFENQKKHKATEEQLIHNEKRFRALIENSTDLKTLTSSGGAFVYASPSVQKIFGYSETEFINKPAYDFFHPDDVQDLLRKRTEILDTPGGSFNFQYRGRHKKGHWVWCEGTLTNMLHEPSINALVSNFSDISERKLAEEQKTFDKNNLDSLINNTDDLLWSVDNNMRLITFNRRFLEVLKASTGKELKQGDDVLSGALSGEHRERFRKLYERALSGESFTLTDEIDGENGYAAEISFYPIRQENDIIGTACSSRDVSQRLKQEKEREKMISDMTTYSKNLEQFAYVVSHNLRAPVANVIGLCNLLNSAIPKKDKERSQQHLLKAVTQLDTVVRDLNKILEIRAILGEQKENVGLTEIVQGIKDSIYETIINEKVVITTEFQVETITTVKSYLYSIFYNLIINSIKYKHDDRHPNIHITSRHQDEKIVIVFTDDGLGIDLTKYNEKVFGLYQRFHTNSTGKGLGLFMVKNQVEALQGTITIRSVPGEGSEFTIELPM